MKSRLLAISISGQCNCTKIVFGEVNRSHADVCLDDIAHCRTAGKYEVDLKKEHEFMRATLLHAIIAV